VWRHWYLLFRLRVSGSHHPSGAATHPRRFLCVPLRPQPSTTLFPYSTLFRSAAGREGRTRDAVHHGARARGIHPARAPWWTASRSEEHTSELQSREKLVCRLLLEKKKKQENTGY